jgi:hypothetical protein
MDLAKVPDADVYSRQWVGPPPTDANATYSFDAQGNALNVLNTALLLEDDEDDPPPPATNTNPADSKQGAPAGAIAGGVVGAVLLIAAAAVVVFFWRKKRNQRHSVDMLETDHGHSEVPRIYSAEPWSPQSHVPQAHGAVMGAGNPSNLYSAPESQAFLSPTSPSDRASSSGVLNSEETSSLGGKGQPIFFGDSIMNVSNPSLTALATPAGAYLATASSQSSLYDTQSPASPARHSKKQLPSPSITSPSDSTAPSSFPSRPPRTESTITSSDSASGPQQLPPLPSGAGAGAGPSTEELVELLRARLEHQWDPEESPPTYQPPPRPPR